MIILHLALDDIEYKNDQKDWHLTEEKIYSWVIIPERWNWLKMVYFSLQFCLTFDHIMTIIGFAWTHLFKLILEQNTSLWVVHVHTKLWENWQWCIWGWQVCSFKIDLTRDNNFHKKEICVTRVKFHENYPNKGLCFIEMFFTKVCHAYIPFIRIPTGISIHYNSGQV